MGGIKGGTDAAKESSDMVLVDDNFASIVAGVEEGRREYDNIARFTRYLLSSNVGELVAIVGALLLGLPLILIPPVQILWINLVTDGLTALALGLEPAERDVMQRRPRDPQEAILTRNAYLVILILGIWLGLLTIYVFLGLYEVDLDRARTMAFTGLIVFELYNVLNFRSFRFPPPPDRVLLESRPAPRNPREPRPPGAGGLRPGLQPLPRDRAADPRRLGAARPARPSGAARRGGGLQEPPVAARGGRHPRRIEWAPSPRRRAPPAGLKH